MNNFIRIDNGLQSWHSADSIARHRHNRAYAAVVLSGSYEECGSRGRFRVGPGDVLLHEAFDAHQDRFRNEGAKILNVVLARRAPRFGIGRVSDPDAIARAAEFDFIEADALLQAQLCEADTPCQDWPDLLAAELLRDPDCRLDSWARRRGLAPETLSRGFRKVFGVTPVRFRAEVRAQRAFALNSNSDAPLAFVAAAVGFADQAHMTRATRALTGSPPSWWRRSSQFKTDLP